MSEGTPGARRARLDIRADVWLRSTKPTEELIVAVGSPPDGVKGLQSQQSNVMQRLAAVWTTPNEERVSGD